MNGIINVIKPPAMSSNGVTVYLRKLLNERKIGHAGTLDPQAAGVLVCLVGRSTRLSDHLMAERKVYVAEIIFGVETDTMDIEGEVTGTDDRKISCEDLRQALKGFTGRIEQIPPKYSAIKIGGRKAYELARRGQDVELKKRTIDIYSIDIAEKTGDNRYLLRIECSKGTYVRTLLSDIGKSLGTCATTSLLIREASGRYDLQSAYTLDEIRDMAENNDLSFLMSPEDALPEFGSISLDEMDTGRIKNGVPVDTEESEGSILRIYGSEGFLGLGEVIEGKLRMKVTLY